MSIDSAVDVLVYRLRPGSESDRQTIQAVVCARLGSSIDDNTRAGTESFRTADFFLLIIYYYWRSRLGVEGWCGEGCGGGEGVQNPKE